MRTRVLDIFDIFDLFEICQIFCSRIETRAAARATPEAPLAWLSMESDGDRSGALGAALVLRLWPGDLHLALGRADFHGRWIDWRWRPQS